MITCPFILFFFVVLSAFFAVRYARLWKAGTSNNWQKAAAVIWGAFLAFDLYRLVHVLF